MLKMKLLFSLISTWMLLSQSLFCSDGLAQPVPCPTDFIPSVLFLCLMFQSLVPLKIKARMQQFVEERTEANMVTTDSQFVILMVRLGHCLQMAFFNVCGCTWDTWVTLWSLCSWGFWYCVIFLMKELNTDHFSVFSVFLPVDGCADWSCDSCFCRWSCCVPSLQKIQTVKSVSCTLCICAFVFIECKDVRNTFKYTA